MKVKSSLVKLISHGKVVLTLCQDGYVLDSAGKKLYVLKKEPIQLIKTILEDFQEPELAVTATTRVVKYNGTNQFETGNTGLLNELLRIIYCADNIKFPQPELVEVLDLIQDDLVASGV